jgi:magnesium-transporting ATPase (P-type)
MLTGKSDACHNLSRVTHVHAQRQVGHAVTAVCFDKTGTLTFGRPRVVDAHILPTKVDTRRQVTVYP